MTKDEYYKFKFGTRLEDQIASLDLSKEEGLKVLASAEIRMNDGNAEIYYKNNWWKLGRTDLTDNVATSLGYSSRFDCTNMDKLRNYYAEKIGYGVRLDKEYNLFSIVDSWSDG